MQFCSKKLVRKITLKMRVSYEGELQFKLFIPEARKIIQMRVFDFCSHIMIS